MRRALRSGVRRRGWVPLLIGLGACGGRVLPVGSFLEPDGGTRIPLGDDFAEDASVTDASGDMGTFADGHDAADSGADANLPWGPVARPEAATPEGADAAAASQPACDDYRTVWAHYRVADASDPCTQCFADAKSSCPAPDQYPCAASFACMVRNCTCIVGEQRGACASTPVPNDMCACLDSCLPSGANVCRQRWLDNMSCVEQKCLSVCSE